MSSQEAQLKLIEELADQRLWSRAESTISAEGRTVYGGRSGAEPSGWVGSVRIQDGPARKWGHRVEHEEEKELRWAQVEDPVAGGSNLIAQAREKP